MKKMVWFVLVLAMCLCLTACGNQPTATAKPEKQDETAEAVVSTAPAQVAEGDVAWLLMEEHSALTKAGEEKAAAAVLERLGKVLAKREQSPQALYSLLDPDEILTAEAKAMMDGFLMVIASKEAPEKPQITKSGYDWGALE